MKKIIIALICALCTMCAKEAYASDTTLTVGQIYDGGVIKGITVYESMAVIQKDGSALSLPMADDALIDKYYYINTVVVRNGTVVLATGRTPKWVVALVVIIIILFVIWVVMMVVLRG